MSIFAQGAGHSAYEYTMNQFYSIDSIPKKKKSQLF